MSEPVVVFPTCLVDITRPEVTSASYALLRRAACEPTAAKGATCCGQPAFNAGYLADARRVARRTVRALAKTSGPVIVPSGSCATMLARHTPHLFDEGTALHRMATSVAARVQELATFVASRLPAVARPGEAVVYHDSCHMLRELGEREAPRALLSGAGRDVREIPGQERCCGFGGTFSVKLPAVSVAMADEKLDEVVATGASTLVGCDLSCLMHLEGRASRRGLDLDVRHIAEVL